MEDIEVPSKKYPKTQFSESDKVENSRKPVLQGHHVQILEAGIGKARSELFRKKVTELGGTSCSSISDCPNMLIVDENMTADRLCRLLKIEGLQHIKGATVVQSLWLSDCIRSKKLLSTEGYELQLGNSCSAVSSAKINLSVSQQQGTSQAAVQDAAHSLRPREDSDADSHYVASGEEEDAEGDTSVSNEATNLQQQPLPVCFLFLQLSLLTLFKDIIFYF